MPCFSRCLVAACVVSWLLAASLPAAAACGDNPGDAAAVAAVRGQIADQCNCTDSTAHGKYVRCARSVTQAAKLAGNLPADCVRTVMHCAMQSAIGRPGAVACCTTSARGVTRGHIKRNASVCRAPAGGKACVAYALSVCDACDASGCVLPPTPTPSPTPTPTPEFCPQPQVPLPNLIQVPLTLQNGTTNCGGPAFSPPASTPFSGEVDDVNGVKLADLGLGCLYAGGLPALSVPGGSTAEMSVVGTSGTQLVLGPSAGNGPSNCTHGAGPNKHCINGTPGTDGQGACASDADCGAVAGACALDANCFFGPPIPTAVGPIGVCVVDALLTDICGTADLSGNAQLAATISARLYSSSNTVTPCPQCVNGACSAGPNVGKSCTASGPASTSSQCPPKPATFLGTLTVPLAPLTTTTSTLSATGDSFCPGLPPPTPSQQLVCVPPPPVPSAFGLANAGTIKESGTGLVSANLLSLTLGATFCIPPSGNTLLDQIAGLPVPGALSVSGQLDLTNAVPLLGGLLP